MKTKLFYFFLIAIIIGACTSSKSSKIEGAWKLVYNKSVSGDSIYYSFPGKDTTEGQIKLCSNGHVSFTGIIKWDAKNPPVDNFGAGSYKLTGNQYEETYLYCSYKPIIGQTLKFKLEIKNDTLIHTSLEKDGKFDKSSYMIEKYIRLDWLKEQDKFYRLWGDLSSLLKKYRLSDVAYEVQNATFANDPELWKELGIEVCCAQYDIQLETPDTDRNL